MKKLWALLALLIATPVAAQDVHREVAGWSIIGSRLDDGEGACYMEGKFEANTSIIIYVGNSDRNKFYFRFSNPAWRSLVEGRTYQVSITFNGDATPYRFSARGNIDSSSLLPGIGFVVELGASDFVGTFMGKQSLMLSVDGRVVDTFNLAGTRPATISLAECIRDIGNGPNYDPFRSGQSAPTRQPHPGQTI